MGAIFYFHKINAWILLSSWYRGRIWILNMYGFSSRECPQNTCNMHCIIITISLHVYCCLSPSLLFSFHISEQSLRLGWQINFSFIIMPAAGTRRAGVGAQVLSPHNNEWAKVSNTNIHISKKRVNRDRIVKIISILYFRGTQYRKPCCWWPYWLRWPPSHTSHNHTETHLERVQTLHN